MAESKSKFAGMFNTPPESPAEAPAGRVEQRVSEAPAPRQIRAVGRPPGKRSDPAWKQYSVLLRRDTQRAAVDILRDRDEGDLSGLVQKLLEGWVKKQKT